MATSATAARAWIARAPIPRGDRADAGRRRRLSAVRVAAAFSQVPAADDNRHPHRGGARRGGAKTTRVGVAPADAPPAPRSPSPSSAALGSFALSATSTTPSPPRVNPHPLDSGGVGWDAVELHDLTGLAWAFTTPSSTDGRKITRKACEAKGIKMTGSSDWRKEDWIEAAKPERGDVTFLDTFASVPSLRGFRICWAEHGVALLYVPGKRRFYTMTDVKNGVANAKADTDADGVIAAIESIRKKEANASFAEAYAIATDPAAAAAAAAAAPYPGSDDADGGDGLGLLTREGEASRGATDRPTKRQPAPEPQTCVAKWCVGRGVSAAAFHAEYGVHFDFHGPAGVISQDVVAAAAEAAGSPLPPSAVIEWPKQRWVDAMEEHGIEPSGAHAPLSSIGRGWKVCWVGDAVERECPAVCIWAPEENAYYTLGSLSAAGAKAPAPVEAAIRAIVGVAKSTPPPKGLKAALTTDNDFLTLLGRKPSEETPTSVGTTGGEMAAVAADAAAAKAGTLPSQLAARKVEEAEEAEEEEEEDEEEEEEGGDAATPAAAAAAAESSPPAAAAAAAADDGDYFREPEQLGDYEWGDSRTGLRRRPDRVEDDDSGGGGGGMMGAEGTQKRDIFADDPLGFNDVVGLNDYDAPLNAPGFEDVPGMEGFVADERVTGQGEFFSRSAGYLSFVDGSWSKEDLAREMGLERHPDDPPVTPRDFPDLSEKVRQTKSGSLDLPSQSDGGAELGFVADVSSAKDFKEVIPRGLPKDFESYHPLRLHGVDYLIARTNDGRLDVREIMAAKRREDGNFAGEAQRVDTSAAMHIPPGYYNEVAWTERELRREESHDESGGPTDYDTLEENTTKVYLVWAQNPHDEKHAFDRKLDFTKPVIVLDNDGNARVESVKGAEEHGADGVLVIRDGELFVEKAEALPNWEEVCQRWEREKATKRAAETEEKVDLHADFLKEVEDTYIPDDTPDVDNF